MKQIFTALLEGLTYRDLSGRRRPRTYVVTACLSLLVLALLAALVWLMQRPVVIPTLTEQPLPSQIVTAPSPTLPPTRKASPTPCPSDPSDWSLADVMISQNYKLIQPACVYEGLARTVAWALAIQEGYTRSQAAQALGFYQMPIRRLGQVEILTDDGGPLEVAVSFTPPHPDLAEWRVDDQEQPAVTYALRGCFRTSTLVGNRTEAWGGDYPVICVLVQDSENSYAVYSLQGHAYTAPATPTRSFLLFGYLEEGEWVWLGTQDDPQLPIQDPAAFADERQTVATLYDSQPWDATWLRTRYGMVMQPMPDDWRRQTDDSQRQAVLQALDAYLNQVQP